MKKLLIALLSVLLLASCGGTKTTPTNEGDKGGQESSKTQTKAGKFLEMSQAEQTKVMTAISQAAATEIQKLATTVTDPKKIAEETQKIMKKVAGEKYPDIDFGAVFDTPAGQ